MVVLVIQNSNFLLLKKLPNCFLTSLYYFSFPLGIPIFSTFLITLNRTNLFNFGHFNRGIEVLIYIFLMIKHLNMLFFLATCVSFFGEVSESSTYF